MEAYLLQVRISSSVPGEFPLNNEVVALICPFEVVNLSNLDVL